MSRRNHVRSVVRSAAYLVLSAASLVPSVARAADHRDGPRVTNNASTLGALDLNDLYVFTSPAHPNNSVFVLTTGGAAVGILSPPYFYPGGVYEFRLSNDGNPLTDEIVFQVAFSDPDRFLRQSYIVVGVDEKTGQSTVLAKGVTGKAYALQGGGAIQAGIFDDPFFFDLLAFNKFKEAVQAGEPLAARVAPFLPPNIPNDFFANFNVLAIVVEVPRGRVQASPTATNISVWIRTLMNDGVQFDRMGRPAINTAVGFSQAPAYPQFPSIQDEFNSLIPANDPALRPAAAARIHSAFGLALPQAGALATMLLPDVTTFSTTDQKGFLNGRRLTDDVIDAELSLLTGGALTSDRVHNDSVFSLNFPYLGAAQPRPSQKATNKIIEYHENSGN